QCGFRMSKYLARRWLAGSTQQALANAPVYGGQGFQFVHGDTFVHLVDSGVDRADLDDLGPHRRDEAAVGSAAAGALFGIDAVQLAADGDDGFAQHAAGRGEEGFAGEVPVQDEVETVALQDGLGACAQVGGAAGGAVAEVDQGDEFAGDHVVGTGAGVEVGDL